VKIIDPQSAGGIPLPFQIDDFAPTLDRFIRLVEPEDFVLHNRIVDKVINGMAGEAKHPLQRLLEQNV
jgi:hypothetical protein